MRGFGRTVPVMGVIIDHFVDHPFGNMGHVNMCNYRTACEEERAVYPEMDDSEEACAVSFSTSPPSQLHSSHFSCQPPAVRMADPCYLTACTAAHPHQPCRGVQAEHQRVVICSHADTSHHVPAPPSSRDTEALTRSGGTSGSSPSDIQKTTFWRKVGAFVNKPHSQVTTTGVELPFAAFVSKTLDLEENDPMVRPPESPSTASPSPGSLHSVSSSQSGGPTQDDYILVDFKPAFSKDGLLPMDLGTFYREFQNPPQLSVVSADDSAQSMAEDLDSLPEKLASYEKNMEEFDAFVETLQ